MQDLKIGILQFDQVWQDKQANFEKISELLSVQKTDIDLLLLPEMFQTGFTMDVSFAEEMNGPSIQILTELARSRNCAIYTSLIIEEKQNFFNRGVFISPDGLIHTYDKRKSFGLGGEDQYFTAGKNQTIVAYKDWKINLQICYDLRFPELCRNKHNDEQATYDVLLYVANWPSKRILHWDSLLKARAIENQCYVLACNRVGNDANQLNYNGHSQAIDMFGNELLAPQEQEGLYVVHISADALIEGRNNLPFLKDA
jgi:predicted amidohydrolase